ncbi:hypothetical protein CBL_07259 [Carabus blaptoides fortunei]
MFLKLSEPYISRSFFSSLIREAMHATDLNNHLTQSGVERRMEVVRVMQDVEKRKINLVCNYLARNQAFPILASHRVWSDSIARLLYITLPLGLTCFVRRDKTIMIRCTVSNEHNLHLHRRNAAIFPGVLFPITRQELHIYPDETEISFRPIITERGAPCHHQVKQARERA